MPIFEPRSRIGVDEVQVEIRTPFLRAQSASRMGSKDRRYAENRAEPFEAPGAGVEAYGN